MKVIEQSHTVLTPVEIMQGFCVEMERAGRTAYKSEDRITIGSAERFVRGIVKRGHESVLEHCSISVRFITDRGVTHELVRHRIGIAFTQESTRYCNYGGKDIVFIKPVFWDEFGGTYIKYSAWWAALAKAEVEYNNLISMGALPQEARTVLPNSLKTEIVATANIREWRHIFTLRTAKTAHPQMRALMIPLLKELQTLLPALFDDIIVEE